MSWPEEICEERSLGVGLAPGSFPTVFLSRCCSGVTLFREGPLAEVEGSTFWAKASAAVGLCVSQGRRAAFPNWGPVADRLLFWRAAPWAR